MFGTFPAWLGRAMLLAAAAVALAAHGQVAVGGAVGYEIRVESEIPVPASHAKAQVHKVRHADPARIAHVALPPRSLAEALVPRSEEKNGIPLQIGVPRPVPALEAHDATRSWLGWQSLPDGGIVAALSIASPGAVAIRLGLHIIAMPASALVRFYSAAGDEVFEVTGREILDTIARNREAGESGADAHTFWSPAIEDATGVLEIELAPGVQPAELRIAVPTISHLVTSVKTDFLVPQAVSCEIDAMCYRSTWGVESNAVARMIFTSGGSTFACTGTLVADSDATTVIPYFLTANHCISTQSAASSLQTYWFWRSTACNSGVTGAYSALTGGATLLYATAATDTSFMRLNATPPAGVTYAGWLVGAATATGTGVTALHNPGGDLQKITFGTMSSYATCTPPSRGTFTCQDSFAAVATFYVTDWTSGITEPGSSGSGLFTNNGHYLIGQLYGGSSSCSVLGTDYYGRLDVAYNTSISQWLGPSVANQTLLVTLAGTGSGTVTSTPAGINCGATCSAGFPTGSVVTLNATAGSGSIFAGWGGGCTGTAACAVTMTQGVSVTATFNSSSSSDANVALASTGAVATASSTYSAAYPVGAVNDNERAGRNWGSGGGWNDATAGVYPDWVQITFNGSKTINRVVVYTLQDNLSNPVEPSDTMTFSRYGVTDFVVEGWNGSSWVALGTVSANNLVKRTVAVTPFTTDRIRVTVNGSLSSFSRITEIEAWGTAASSAPSGTNVALASAGAAATASSTYGSGYPVAAVNDNERAGRNWGSGGGWNDATENAYPDSVQIAFNGTKTIDRIVVYTLQDNYPSPIEPTDTLTFTRYGITDFVVDGWDGSNWVRLGSASGNNLVKRTLTFAAFTTDRIRVTVNGALGGFSRITEIEAWGSDAAVPPAGSNVALASAGAVASASSVYSAAYPVAAINDNERAGRNWGAGGGWNDATANLYPDSVQINFSGPKTINRVVVYTLQDNYASPVEPTDTLTFTRYGITDFTVEGWSEAGWVKLATVSGNNFVKRTVTFPALVTPAIRVTVDNALAGYARVTEVEAWGN